MAHPVPGEADERGILCGFLDLQRAVVPYKLEGLTDQQARRQFVPSQLTTCAGVVRHLRYVERGWFQEVLMGEQLPDPEPLGVPDAEFVVTQEDTLAQLLRDYEQECERSREVTARLRLGDVARNPEYPRSLRWVLVHMIEETARHNGHLDLIRELLDGTTGDLPEG